ncbi:hypothetical protein CYMTET_13137 [Cymbomonas tetramitiformis]|uniref:Uncharacterized protein n=1 Tax=Cymbomonas tetramitiformis TaxID=36881 RepID=A0AAE0GIY8_9CHLO|nr:hypothetical protein CYMTET_13137 [Cymbomonas tetramitiformis]
MPQTERSSSMKKECNDMLQKRSAAERQLLDYKLKRAGIWAREVIWENAKVMSAADFWFLYGARSKELQLTGMRACGQVSGVGAAERGHKDMNLIETKSRNRMHWDNVEAWVYVKHNSLQVDKRERLSFTPTVIPWTEGVEENEEWEDGWQEEDLAESAECRARRISRSAARAENISQASSRRITPEHGPLVTASGRTVTPPQVLTF